MGVFLVCLDAFPLREEEEEEVEEEEEEEVEDEELWAKVAPDPEILYGARPELWVL